MLRLAPALTLLLTVGPILLGVAAAAVELDGSGLRALIDAPGLGSAVLLSLWTGLCATAMSLALVAAIGAAFHDSHVFALLRRALGPLLAVPHAAMAIGLAFLIAPSGWLMRLLSPWLTGLDAPPDLALVKDPYGLALIAGLTIKEMPFLFLMMLAALNQVDARRTVHVARSLGYRPAIAWMRTVWPQIYPQLRLPVFAVLVFSLSVVDMALVLAPNTPPPLAVLITRWATEADPLIRQRAIPGAALMLLLAVGAVATWALFERLIAVWTRATRINGRRDGCRRLGSVAGSAAGLLLSAALLSLAGIGLWSIADIWRFPDPVPSAWSLTRWAGALGETARPLLTTLALGVASVAIAVILVLCCLENETRRRITLSRHALWLLYTPLLVPQISLLASIQTQLIRGGLDGTWVAVVWSHLIYVMPYVYLSLSAPFHALDSRYRRSALALGASANRVFWRVKFPILLRPVLIAVAVGFAVSVAQYLPTVFAGGGRLETLTTEAVTLSSGGDRRIVGVYSALQATLPFIGFALAVAIPAWLFRHRSGMRAFR